MRKIIGVLTLLSGAVFMNTAFADNCRLTDDYKRNNGVTVNLELGRIAINPNAPLGSVLYKQTKSFGGAEAAGKYFCENEGSVKFKGSVESSEPPINGNIYPTGIEGIGLKFTRTWDKGEFTFPFAIDISRKHNENYSLANSSFTVELVKTGNVVGSGSIKSENRIKYYMDEGEINITTPMLTVNISANSFNVITPSCNITHGKDLYVSLNPQKINDFKGIGTTVGGKNFNIDLQCNGGSGYAGNIDVNMSFSGKVPSTLAKTNGVLENEYTGSDVASGVGIKITHEGKAISLDDGDKLVVGSLTNDETKNLSIPFVASYYQYADEVTAGKVESHMVFNVDYD